MNTELLHKYFDQQTTVAEEAELLDWLDESEENQLMYDRERALWARFIFDDYHEEQSEDNIVKLKPVKSSRNNFWYKIAAVFLLFALSAVVLYRYYAERPVEMISVTVPSGKQMKLVLSDGSLVWLNSETKFVYPVKFTGTKRLVSLDGEGYFEVKHEVSRPFQVSTSTHLINVLGTVFNIDAYKESDFFTASLISGKVAVKSQNDGISRTLLPNQQLVYNTKTKQITLTNTDALLSISWKTGTYFFDRIPLSEVFKQIEHYKGVKINVTDSSILRSPYTGKFRQQEDTEDIMTVLQAAVPMRFKFNETKNLIYISHK